MSPDLITHSFKREVVYKNTSEFKGALLKDLKNLFPEDESPFFSGFGNRENVF